MNSPNITYNMPDADYHAVDALSQSKLNMILRNPHEYWAYYEAKLYERPTTESMKFGKDFHCYLLTPEVFEETYLVKPKIVRSGKKWEAYQEEAEASGKTIIFQETVNQFLEIAESIKRQQIICRYKNFFEACKTEVSLFWEDKKHGVKMKARIDLLKNNHLAFVDIKKVRSANPEKFMWSVRDYGYELQAYVYRQAVKNVLGVEPKSIYFLCVEERVPYNVKLIEMSAQQILDGEQRYEYAIEKYLECRQSGYWPVYTDEKVGVV